MSENNAADADTVPHGYVPRPDKYASPAERMAAFDALPQEVRMAMKYLPVEINVGPVVDVIAYRGQRHGTKLVLEAIDRMWRDFGEEPLRP